MAIIYNVLYTSKLQIRSPLYYKAKNLTLHVLHPSPLAGTALVTVRSVVRSNLYHFFYPPHCLITIANH